MTRSDSAVDCRAAVAAAALALLFAACDGDAYRSTPTAPSVRGTPAPPPPPPPPPSTSSLPVTEEATPGTYERTTPDSLGLDSRIAFEGNGLFRLEYESVVASGTFGYAGTYARDGKWYLLAFEGWNTGYAWASFGGACVDVEFDPLMQLSDFENGRFCR